MSKHYFTTLANRPMVLSGHRITFAVCSVSGGRAAGVYEASDPQEIAVLDDAVRGRRGVQEISAEEFDRLKKKASLIQTSSSSNVWRPRVVQTTSSLLPIAMEPKAGVPSAASGAPIKPAAPAPDDIPPLPTVTDLVRVEKVNPPQPFAVSAERVRRAVTRADRAKAKAGHKG